MLLATTDLRTEYEVLGMVKGSSTKAKHLGKDIMAFFRKIVGGDVKEYAELLQESRDEAESRMIAEAEKLGANAIIGIRFSTSSISQGMAEMLAYGTAVRIR
ncbi:MAG: YbjQ family protein [Firmicutes bacterium]|nr:YbjQ family protein [Bacillota bacterium]